MVRALLMVSFISLALFSPVHAQDCETCYNDGGSQTCSPYGLDFLWERCEVVAGFCQLHDQCPNPIDVDEDVQALGQLSLSPFGLYPGVSRASLCRRAAPSWMRSQPVDLEVSAAAENHSIEDATRVRAGGAVASGLSRD